MAGEPPTLVVTDAPCTSSMPVLHTEDDAFVVCGGWRLVAHLPMCVVDGPGEDGFLVHGADLTNTAEVEERNRWLDDVEAAGGVVVILKSEAAPDRGGFVSWP